MIDPADYTEEYTNHCAELVELRDAERNKRMGIAKERDDAWTALCAACDLLSLQGPTFAWKAKGLLEAAGVPLTLTVREECGMPREGGDEP